MERRTGMEGFVRWRPGEEAHRSFSGTVAEVGDGSGGIGRSAEVTPCGSGARRSSALLQADEGFRGRRRWFFRPGNGPPEGSGTGGGGFGGGCSGRSPRGRGFGDWATCRRRSRRRGNVGGERRSQRRRGRGAPAEVRTG
ncbi:uncharacterized protein M6B38_142935 [Iris pallida]|uniref:Uncharacterized protein n=1 Tax=Iris pallida TaxID=29817 RepID=A0AAX6FCR4_IRIPA|nr:uncharacterized protein M6B38_142935 [Iris pallida]